MDDQNVKLMSDISSDISDMLDASIKTASIVEKGVYVNNISEVLDYFSNVIPVLQKSNIAISKNHLALLEKIKEELSKNKITGTKVINPEEIFKPLDIKLENILSYLKEVKPPVVNVEAPIVNVEKQDAPIVNVPKPDAPIINVAAPIVNVDTPIVNVDLDKLDNSLKEYLANIIYNSEKNPLAVRLSDGDKWLDELKVLTNKVAETAQWIPNSMFLKNPGGGIANPATEESLSQLAGKFAIQIDDVTTTSVMYVGKASPGTSTSSPNWQIMKIDKSGTPITTVITWADGNSNFDNVYSNRASLTYS